jgi:hypothetical protein
MSSPVDPQTDGHTEKLNQTLGCLLRNDSNYEQDNWEEMLPMADYAYNKSLHSTVKMTPFFPNYSYHRETNWPTAEPSPNPTSQNQIQWMTCVHHLCHQGLGKASKTMRKYDDKTAKPAPVYQLGDVVMLKARKLKTRRPARKLDAILHGPFRVVKVLSHTALKLELPSQWQIHNAFHVSLIEHFRIPSNPIQNPLDLDATATDVRELGYDVD